MSLLKKAPILFASISLLLTNIMPAHSIELRFRAVGARCTNYISHIDVWYNGRDRALAWTAKAETVGGVIGLPASHSSISYSGNNSTVSLRAARISHSSTAGIFTDGVQVVITGTKRTAQERITYATLPIKCKTVFRKG